MTFVDHIHCGWSATQFVKIRTKAKLRRTFEINFATHGSFRKLIYPNFVSMSKIHAYCCTETRSIICKRDWKLPHSFA